MRANLAQFSLLVLVNAFVGAMAGMERSILPAIAEHEFYLATIGDMVHPASRASAVGVYRLWRDLGYAAGALISGVVADLLSVTSAVWVVAGLTFLSGTIASVRMRETLARDGTKSVPDRPE